MFSLRKIAIFLVSSFQKSIKFRCQNAFENDIEKKGSQIEFGHRFGSPKTIKMAPKSDVKRSLFRDAMEITRESSEINGSRRLQSVQMATHMIRSSRSMDGSTNRLIHGSIKRSIERSNGLRISRSIEQNLDYFFPATAITTPTWKQMNPQENLGGA